MAELADISEELDNLALRFLDVTESIISEQNHLNEILSNGYVNMAKARYIMGNKNVSMQQVNEADMVASSLVCTETVSYGSVQYVDFKIAEECNTAVQEQKVRRRKGVDHDTSDSKDSSEDSSKKNEISSANRKNPLRWFGVLVPKSLKTCQSQFNESLVLIAKIASLKSELLSVHEKYKELLAKEKEIKNCAS